jgi:hypothetical protein
MYLFMRDGPLLVLNDQPGAPRASAATEHSISLTNMDEGTLVRA